MSEKDYNTYVDDCLDKGYDSDYYRYDDSFHGTNNKHEKRDLSVEWERNKVMHIYLMVGSALAGAAVGSIVPGAGTAVGLATGFVGSLVGTAVASEAYNSVVEQAPEVAKKFVDKAQSMARNAVTRAEQVVPDKVDSIKESLNNFFNNNNIPVTE